MSYRELHTLILNIHRFSVHNKDYIHTTLWCPSLCEEQCFLCPLRSWEFQRNQHFEFKFFYVFFSTSPAETLSVKYISILKVLNNYNSVQDKHHILKLLCKQLSNRKTPSNFLSRLSLWKFICTNMFIWCQVIARWMEGKAWE